MRLGLIGLDRIGAFRTNTLVGIPAIDSLAALLGSGIDGVIIAAGTDRRPVRIEEVRIS